jgi:hypothetical protein
VKKTNLIIIFFFILINNLIFLNLQSQIINNIMIKVGGSLVTSIDLQNEIITNLVINKQEITQENINNNKNYAIKNLIKKSIKISEVNKYQIKNYNKEDLLNYIEGNAKNLNTDRDGLKEIFKQNSINYQKFIDNHKVELLWNTLIYKLYKNQTNINIVEVENEVDKIKENKSKDELKKLKETILNKKRKEKFNLFSRSHFTNLKNTITIDFQ